MPKKLKWYPVVESKTCGNCKYAVIDDYNHSCLRRDTANFDNQAAELTTCQGWKHGGGIFTHGLHSHVKTIGDTEENWEQIVEDIQNGKRNFREQE